MSRMMKGTLWGVFATLLFLSAARLLFGCALTVPAFLQLRYCPALVDITSINREKARREGLEQRIHDAEITLARVPPCAN